MSNAAKRVPSFNLTTESRSDRHWVDWHQANDEEFDLQLDFLYDNENLQGPNQDQQQTSLNRDYAYGVQQSTTSTTMPSSDNTTLTAATGESLRPLLRETRLPLLVKQPPTRHQAASTTSKIESSTSMDPSITTTLLIQTVILLKGLQ